MGTGGSVCLVLETETEARRRRGATPYAKFTGWGQGSDGHNVAISHPEGRGLKDSMQNALKDAEISPENIDYVNAHAPSTPIGDASEMKALKATFSSLNRSRFWHQSCPRAHGLSLSSIMEACLLLSGP